MKHVVIIGGGFAGVRVARKLKNKKDVTVTLINATPDFRYGPALYRAATGGKMGAARIALEGMLLGASNVDLVVATVTKIDPKTKTVTLADKTKIQYDVAVFALGAVTTYFNIEGIHEHSYGIKTAEEIMALRKHLHKKITDKSEAEANYVIVGGGPTGVEVAGELGHYLKKIARKHGHASHKISIYLVEAAARLTPVLPPKASAGIAKQLQKIGVKILTNTFVKAETINTLKTSAGPIKTHTVIWTAGAATNPFYKAQGNVFDLAKNSKVIVNRHLEAMPHVYVLGDNAFTKYSGLALVAIWHANFVAKDILAQMHHATRPKKYEYKPVSVVPIGSKWAVLNYGKIVMYGWSVSLIRKVADYVAYSDILGFLGALVVWTNSERTEDTCGVCHSSHR